MCFRAAVPVQVEEPLMASMLAAVPPEEQKQMLGKSHSPTQIPMCSNTLLLSGIEHFLKNKSSLKHCH